MWWRDEGSRYLKKGLECNTVASTWVKQAYKLNLRGKFY